MKIELKNITTRELVEGYVVKAEVGVWGGWRLDCRGSCLLGHLSRDRQGTEAVFRWGRERGLSG